MEESKPLRVHIRASSSAMLLGEALPDAERKTNLETALQMVEEVKKLHPNAEISIEVET